MLWEDTIVRVTKLDIYSNIIPIDSYWVTYNILRGYRVLDYKTDRPNLVWEIQEDFMEKVLSKQNWKMNGSQTQEKFRQVDQCMQRSGRVRIKEQRLREADSRSLSFCIYLSV